MESTWSGGAPCGVAARGRTLWVGVYAVCTAIVGLHLRHGISSAFQSLGLDHPLYTRRLTTWGIIGAIIIGGGLAFIPIWVYLAH